MMSKKMAKIVLSEWWARDSLTSGRPFLLIELERCIDSEVYTTVYIVEI